MKIVSHKGPIHYIATFHQRTQKLAAHVSTWSLTRSYEGRLSLGPIFV